MGEIKVAKAMVARIEKRIFLNAENIQPQRRLL
jgi:hypothetical protein